MARKTRLQSLLLVAIFLSGCATARKEPAAPQYALTAPPTPPRPAATPAPEKPKTRPAPRPARPRPQPGAAAENRAGLPVLIDAGATWTAPGFQSLAVGRGTSPRQPVPIFRQAGTLAAVRAALADSPAQPRAEFRNGVLTLKFDRGSNEEIASAVNKTLSVTGSRNLQVTLQP
jgi:hypothetical protein